MPRRSFIQALLGATLLSPFVAGCSCLLLACSGGFVWQAMPDSGTVEPGVYRFIVTLEGNASFELACEVGSGSIVQLHDCERMRESEDTQFRVSLDFVRPELANADPIDGFTIFVSADDGKNTIGPQQVGIEVTRDGDLLASEDYDVEYVRDDEYAGGPHCGFCDQLESRLHVWAE